MLLVLDSSWGCLRFGLDAPTDGSMMVARCFGDGIYCPKVAEVRAETNSILQRQLKRKIERRDYRPNIT